jgi:plastocyanin
VRTRALRLIASLVAMLAVGLTLAAAQSATSVNSSVVIVKIGNFTYEPQSVTVKPGTVVKWVNEDDVPHTVTGSDAGSPLHSSALDTDDSYTATVNAAGTYKYFCAIHPHMVGTLVVAK